MAFMRFITSLIERIWSMPFWLIRFLSDWVIFNPRLGLLRYVVLAAGLYVVAAVMLVYVVAPIRGYAGQAYLADRLHYDAERWLAAAIYDNRGDFVGTFDARLDSKQDVNFTGQPIAVGSYVANPDHKSIPVRDVPPAYWRCLVYHEDRHIGGLLNPFGIDLAGVLKIPYSTIKRSLKTGRVSFGVGGSTLPMQFARVIYKTPPRADESAFEKLGRKLNEWWIAPVIYAELTRGGDDTPLKQWAANHLWLAQRTGGASLHGVETAAQIVFGKQAKDLSTAQQFVLASAVNKPIILLEGSERLNAVRMDRWRYITEVRARLCAERLIDDPKLQSEVLFELIGLAGGPPDPQVKPRLLKALEAHAPDRVQRAEANPTIRANTLLPSARFGMREEMKQTFGFEWRNHVRGVTSSLDASENLAFHERMTRSIARLQKDVGGRIDPGFSLEAATRERGLETPDVTVVAADADGRIVRYFELNQTASYFGSPHARSLATGYYDASREPRMIASTGKVLVALAIANAGGDTRTTRYLDRNAPSRGLETCRRNGELRRVRTAEVSFACSLNGPILARALKLPKRQLQTLIDGFGMTMPPAGPTGEGTPPATAAVFGQISGAPRRVHHMSAAVLAGLMGRGTVPVMEPTLIETYDYISKASENSALDLPRFTIVPDRLMARDGRSLVRQLLSAPLCYRANKTSHGTLKSLSNWCASRRSDLRLHFAKTGTQVSVDPNATVDAWATGGLQFSNGAAYSYVVVVGTGSSNRPWARNLHSSQLAAPLLGTLLDDLKDHAKANPRADLLPRPARPARSRPVARANEPAVILPDRAASATRSAAAKATRGMSDAEIRRIFETN
ncbi:MAG: transglycosylase domain-containing protein [Pseudomonadota bacterium]